MIKKIIVVALALLACAIAPFLIDEKGYILIAMGDLTYELTVVGALILLILASLVFVLAYWGIRLFLKYSKKGYQRLALGSKAKAKKEFQQGLACYLVGDYEQAEKSMSKCAISSEYANSAWLVAANSANQRNEVASLENHLASLSEHEAAEQNFSAETLLGACRLYIETKHYDKARLLIDKYHRLVGHDGRLQVVLAQLCLHEDNAEKAIDYLTLAKKDKALIKSDFGRSVLTILEESIYTKHFNALLTAGSVKDVAKAYKGLNRKDRQSEGIILAYAASLVENGLTQQLEDLVLPMIKKDASSTFIGRIKQLPLQKCDHLIFAVQKILQKQPDNPMWMSALAHLSLNCGDLDKAHKAFVALLKLEQNKDDLQTYAKLLEQMGEHQQANRVYQEILAS